MNFILYMKKLKVIKKMLYVYQTISFIQLLNIMIYDFIKTYSLSQKIAAHLWLKKRNWGRVTLPNI